MLTLQSVLSRYYLSYASGRRVRADVQRAAQRILECGTAALGTHVQHCGCGHIARLAFNSCRHRYCPQCSGGRRAQWLNRISGELLPCDHVHVIFTIPEALNSFWRFNRVLFSNLLMQASRESLQQLLGDEKYLGAQPGIISALHTWGRNLSVHPHVHCLVTAGGQRDGAFVVQKRSTLLPSKVLMIVFRARLRVLLRRAIERGELSIPTSLTTVRSLSLLNRLGREPWNVRIQERYRDGVSVAGYLARYITGGPIGNRRLAAITAESVTFRYRDHRDGEEKLMSLSPDVFLARWLEHVPPRGLRMIRRSGLYANCHKAFREELRSRVEPKLPAAPPQVPLEPERCPRCNELVRTYELFRPRTMPNERCRWAQTRAMGQPP